jgi:hypothetical protein
MPTAYPTNLDNFTHLTLYTVRDTGTILLQNNVWQLVTIPVEDKKVKEFFLDTLDNQIQLANPSKNITHYIEVVNTYVGHVNRFYSFVPYITNPNSEHNFQLAYTDPITNELEFTAFWVKTKDYKSFDSNDLIFTWEYDYGVKEVI